MKKVKCKCVDECDKLLAAQHSCVDTTLFTGMVRISTSLVPGAPNHTKPVALVATFCPFCGVQYPNTDTTVKRKLKSAPSAV
jgi:hypothetical protein